MLGANEAQTMARELISVMLPSEPPMNKLFKFCLKLFIGGADQSKTKVGSMALIGLIGLQNDI